MASPDERSFVVFPRGYVRDNIILATFRNFLRTAVNPANGQTFTEDEVIRATAPGTRFYIEADALDLFGQASQQRALFFASQIDPRTANSEFLKNYHGALWLGEDSQLPATSSSGPVLATGVNGTIIPGSIIIPDISAAVATDPNGKRYQNTTPNTIVNGQALLTLISLDTGFVTRLPTGTELRWSSGTNPGTDPTASVTDDFDGGFDAETDEEYAERIVQRIRYRPASGNAVHFQAWAQEASGAVEQAFVYACAMNAGSAQIAILEKRPAQVDGVVPEGPEARIPSVATLVSVANYLIPPASPVVPERALIFVTGVQAQPADLVVRISMSLGRNGGWADVEPWPSYSSSYPELPLTAVAGGGLTLSFVSDVSLPGDVAVLTGANAPSLMIFNEEISRWVELDVASVTDPNPGSFVARTFVVVLNSVPVLYDETKTARIPLIGDRISPFTDRLNTIAKSVEAYFDSLGPGEVVASTDMRFARAARSPTPSVQYPIRAGQGVLRYLLSALGGVAADAELTSISVNEPSLPTNVTDGPNMITFGAMSVFPL
jgi:hypothetical protein